MASRPTTRWQSLFSAVFQPRSEAPASGQGRALLDEAGVVVVGGALAGAAASAADTAVRVGPSGGHTGFWLLVSLGTALGLAAAMLVVGARLVRVHTHLRRAVVLVPLVAGAAATAAAWAPVADTLSGLAERQPTMASWLGAILPVAAGLVAACAIASWQLGAMIAQARAVAVPLVIASATLGVAGLLAWLDLTVMVALYVRAHQILEAGAWFFAIGGASLLSFVLVRRWPWWRWPVRFGALVGLASLALLLRSAPQRAAMDEELSHVWRQPAYLGRALLRVRQVEDRWQDLPAHDGVDPRLERLARRYGFAHVMLAPRWELPRPEAESVPAERGPFNVVVIFVDTLRADTAADASVMPQLAALRRQSLSFERAYSTASDTVSSLPVLTGGCYARVPCEGDMLALAKSRKVRTGLVIAKSAHRFLAKLAPHFTFDEVRELPDYEEGTKVWGYGADQSTAARVTGEALAWLDTHGGQPFMLWAFHFDVHNWSQLELEHVAAHADRAGIARGGDDELWRYRAAAAGVDEAIGQLVAGIEARGLAETTAILLVSDHGEALGESGHQRHAVFLWESLIHVPMLLRVPGVVPARFDAVAGHIDVAPTLVRLLDPRASVAGYHGVDLLGPAASPEAIDAPPVLLFSMRKEELLRIGVVGRNPPYRKLEVSLESSDLALYDLEAPEPDAADVSRHAPARTLELLDALVTSPVFPRPEPEPGPDG